MSMEESGKVVKFLHKVLVVGDHGVGKTNLINRLVHNEFTPEYNATDAVNFSNKVMQISPDKVVYLQLWDIAEQDRYESNTSMYFKFTSGAFAVFDSSRPDTLDSVTKWKNEIDSEVHFKKSKETPIPFILLANKTDLDKNAIDPSQLDQYCKDYGFVKWFETSAKDNINVEEAVNYLVKSIFETEAQVRDNPDEESNSGDADDKATSDNESSDEESDLSDIDDQSTSDSDSSDDESDSDDANEQEKTDKESSDDKTC
ncbi:Rab32A5 [Monocercomonoides exilis]|uniref:Rab32A5 n=1 Tax=Monocercomonoides exilis TaxID=2049356 RepID=UPI003559B15B|nr:Rab32A5 [Monocercomonoides exilis]|eukprot:MONOS_4062.1-p1 / transcript=MONOS_4062.1 / gene=MONOS_4062 / organism=Monocercomonoides_exilis_PA203 / gene_product=Rab32A5 / transcript_product=Rab32A5 / location=Mono_scaffold00103:57640-58589(+) / protein_length=258 / sequence_SO=supercontig / SO=protein_coding / is_pseudo=false